MQIGWTRLRARLARWGAENLWGEVMRGESTSAVLGLFVAVVVDEARVGVARNLPRAGPSVQVRAAFGALGGRGNRPGPGRSPREHYGTDETGHGPIHHPRETEIDRVEDRRDPGAWSLAFVMGG